MLSFFSSSIPNKRHIHRHTRLLCFYIFFYRFSLYAKRDCKPCNNLFSYYLALFPLIIVIRVLIYLPHSEQIYASLTGTQFPHVNILVGIVISVPPYIRGISARLPVYFPAPCPDLRAEFLPDFFRFYPKLNMA